MADSPKALRQLLLDGGGAFNQVVWQTRPSFDPESPADDLTSLHEWCHHELANVTSCGLLLSYFAYLSRHADEDRDRFTATFGSLLKRSETAHEVYATWYSVELLSAAHPVERLLQQLPDDYRAFHDLGERCVGTIRSPFLRQQTFITVLRSCFEAEMFTEFDPGRGLRIADIRGQDFPDERLERAVRLTDATLFEDWTREFVHATPDDGKAIETAIARDHGSFFALPVKEADAVLRRYLHWLANRWSDHLDEYGLRSGPVEKHLELADALLKDLAIRCRDASAHALTATSSPHDSVAVLLKQMETEVVQNRSAPLPLEILPLATLDRSLLGQLPVGQPPHLFVQARRARALRLQHDLSAGDISTPDLAPVMAIRRHADGADGTERAQLFVIQSPDELHELCEANRGVSLLGLVESHLLDDPTWSRDWLHDAITWVTKIDHSLHDFLDEHCRKQAEVIYSSSTLRDEERVVHFLCFLTRSHGDEHFGLYIGFCGHLTAKAAIQFIEDRLTSERMRHEKGPFRELAPILEPVVTHMVRDELFFSFNQLTYDV